MSLIFLDRDGVINHNRHDHVKSWQEFEFLPGSLEALALLHQKGYRVFVITNQAIVGKGLLQQAELNFIHARMLDEVAKTGGAIEAVFSCIHRPEDNCFCRKPQPGLIKLIEQQHQISAKNAWLVGDYTSDIEAGEQAGCRNVLVLSGRGEKAYQTFQAQGKSNFKVATDLLNAVNQILVLSKISLLRAS
jgi:D-glycero-D-manno-heptose 1,7-bisphosphate phosphatase